MKKILLQLDTDTLPSSFDRVVADDVGVDDIISYGGVTLENVEGLVHGAIFTRKPEDLNNTAIFIGGSQLELADRLLEKVKSSFIGELRVSIMVDANGSSTTAAAAVRSAAQHLELKSTEALILGGTGPVGQRAAEILATQGATVRLASRDQDRSQAACNRLRQLVPDAKLVACESSDDGLAAAVDGVQLIIAAGAAGVTFLTTDELEGIDTLKVAIDLNAVPPVGLEGIAPEDRGVDHNGVLYYGALAVGGFKMKLHQAALKQLFTRNDFVLTPSEIYKLSAEL